MGRHGDHGRRLDASERAEIHARVVAGETLRKVSEAVGCSTKSIQRLLAKTGGLPSRIRPRSVLRLSLSEREEISRGLQAHESCRVIARRLDRATSTVSREVTANGSRRRYRAWRADQRAMQRTRRPKTPKLRMNARLRKEVERRLMEHWSPEQIARRLPVDYPKDPEMRVSHETIYKWLFIQVRGTLRKELTTCLRSGRTKRRSRGRMSGVGRLRNMVSISERPAEVEDRLVPGHWEGDLIVGRRGLSAVGTLVERKSRYVLLLDLSEGRTARHVRRALAERMATLPEHLRRTLTWDQGKEMAEHTRFTRDTGIPVYFCDPCSPWQRGTSENTNGLLRQYLPKGTDLARKSQADLDHVARELNGRPRETLGWMKPREVLSGMVR